MAANAGKAASWFPRRPLLGIAPALSRIKTRLSNACTARLSNATIYASSAKGSDLFTLFLYFLYTVYKACTVSSTMSSIPVEQVSLIQLQGSDLFFARIAQGARVDGATLPSGLKVPRGKWIVDGDCIRRIDGEENPE
jgi:hypothetical protein